MKVRKSARWTSWLFIAFSWGHAILGLIVLSSLIVAPLYFQWVDEMVEGLKPTDLRPEIQAPFLLNSQLKEVILTRTCAVFILISFVSLILEAFVFWCLGKFLRQLGRSEGEFSTVRLIRRAAFALMGIAIVSYPAQWLLARIEARFNPVLLEAAALENGVRDLALQGLSNSGYVLVPQFGGATGILIAFFLILLAKALEERERLRTNIVRLEDETKLTI